MAFFDLKYVRSYKTAGASGDAYYFRKGEAKEVVNEADAAKFRAQPEIFLEVNRDGSPVVYVAPAREERTYKRFRELNLDLDSAEALLEKVHQEAAANPRKVDVNELLKAANEDSMVVGEKKVEAEVVDVTPKEMGTIVSDDLPKRTSGSTRAKKVANACDKCGRKFKSKDELEKHLLDHEE